MNVVILQPIYAVRMRKVQWRWGVENCHCVNLEKLANCVSEYVKLRACAFKLVATFDKLRDT